MDIERSIKRLAVMLVASLILIFIAKAMLSKAITNVGTAASKKKQQSAASRQVLPPAASSAIEAPPIFMEPGSGSQDADTPASAVEETAGTL